MTQDDLEGFCQDQWPRLVRAMWLQCGDLETAEDIAQEALVRAWEHWGRLREMARADLWVMRVAFNLVMSRLRRRSIETRARRLVGSPDLVIDGSAAVETRFALLSLPPRQRAAVVLRHDLGYPVREAAAAMGCAEGTVKALTHQGLRSLRERLGKEERVR